MPEATKVYVFCHTHWDREWYRSFQQYRIKLIEIIDLILKELDSEELKYFTLDGQAIILEDYLNVRPENRARLISYIKEGRLLVGPWYILPDEFLVSGESLVENLILGHKISAAFGRVNKIGYLPDTFGHSIDIPIILDKCGINNAVLWRGVNTQYTEFIWSGMDRSHVKAFHLAEGYYNSLFIDNNQSSEERNKQVLEFINKINTRSSINYLLLPVGGDHLPPPIKLQAQIDEFNNFQNEYQLVQGTLQHFLDNINPDSLKEHVQQEFRDCSKNYILPAVDSSRLYLKQENARLTHKINYRAEPLIAYCNLNHLDDFELPDSEFLWKMLIENQPHDSICGCSIDEVHNEMEQRYASLEQATDAVINRAKLALIKNISKDDIAVFNCSNYQFTGPVNLITYQDLNSELQKQKIREFEDRHFRFHSDINEPLPATIIKKQTEYLLWAKDIPPHSLSIIKPAEIINPVAVKEGKLTNDLIEIQINNDSFTLIDLQNNQEYPNLNRITDRLDCGDSYNFGPVKDDTPKIASITGHEILESGPLRGKIKINYQIDLPVSLNEQRTGPSPETINHNISCELTITANSKIVEIDLNWENRSKDHILQAIFPVENDIYTTMVENHFSVIERRFDPHYNIYDHIPAERYTETKTNTAPMQRFVQASGLAVFTEGLPEYEVYKNNLSLTLLRSTGNLSRADVPTRGAEAGPNLATPGCQCLRNCTARYAIHPSAPVPELYRLAEVFMDCIVSVSGESEKDSGEALQKPLLYWQNPNIIATRYKFDAEDKSLILHLLNISQYPQQLDFISDKEIKEIQETDFLKNIQSKLNCDQKLIFRSSELKPVNIKFA